MEKTNNQQTVDTTQISVSAKKEDMRPTETSEVFDKASEVEKKQAEDDESKTPLDIMNEIILLAESGVESTLTEGQFEYDENELKEANSLFSSILNTSKDELLPLLKEIRDFCNHNDEHESVGDIIAKIVDYADQGLAKTGGVEVEPKSPKDPNYIFGAILTLGDIELRQFV